MCDNTTSDSKKTETSEGTKEVGGNNKTYECQVCRETIKNGAIKCPKCGSFQNWRKHMVISTTALSLLVALISVLVFAIPVFEKALKRNAADIKFIYLENDGDKIAILASNQGRKPGVISSALLSGHVSNDEAHSWRLTPEPRYVAQGESVVIVLTKESSEKSLPALYLSDDFDYSLPATKPWSLGLELEVTQLDGDFSFVEIPFVGLMIHSDRPSRTRNKTP